MHNLREGDPHGSFLPEFRPKCVIHVHRSFPFIALLPANYGQNIFNSLALLMHNTVVLTYCIIGLFATKGQLASIVTDVDIGTPGAVKSTHPYRKVESCTAPGRPIAILTLNPANDDLHSW